MSNFTKKKILHRKKTNRNKRHQKGRGLCQSRGQPRNTSTPTPSPESIKKLYDAIIYNLDILQMIVNKKDISVRIKNPITIVQVRDLENKHIGILSIMIRALRDLFYKLETDQVKIDEIKSKIIITGDAIRKKIQARPPIDSSILKGEKKIEFDAYIIQRDANIKKRDETTV